MSIQDVALAVVRYFPPQSQTTMVAIGGTESGWQNEPGDPLRIYSGAALSNAELHQCGGMTSFGWSQINLPSHSDLIASLSGIPASDPCGQAAWLMDYGHSALAAYYVSSGGTDFRPWCTYWRVGCQAGPGQGPYRRYLAEAAKAVTYARTHSTNLPLGGQLPFSLPSWLPVALVGIPIGALFLADLRRA